MTAVLTELHLTGLGVIEDAVLEPHPGFTVVTGETGAGKTMVVTALGLISGGRADSGRVRAGADRAVVEARFDISEAPPIAAQVEAAGGRLDEDGSVILVRSVAADGRSRAHIGGRSAPVGLLAEVTGPLLTVHGQSEAIALLQPASQRTVLDRFAHNECALATYREARREWRTALAELADRTGRARELAQREQLLTLGLADIDKVAPKPGEDTELLAEVRRLENVDALRAAASAARLALTGDGESEDSSAQDLLQSAWRNLDAAGDFRLTEWASAVHGASVVLADVATELSGYLGDLDADPARLEQLMTRQAELRSLTRRYGSDIDAVLDWQRAARKELESLDSSDEALNRLRKRCDKLAGAVALAGSELSGRRAAAAERLAREVTAELSELALGRATVRVAVLPRPAATDTVDAVDLAGRRVSAGSDGLDVVEFLMTAHPGAPELPLARGASGGELSRVMLALEVVLAGADPVGTLVFDEVDAGVGGRAATEIGRRLARLAESHQVIVVTHLAQVAVFADRQVVVDSTEDGAVRRSGLTVVSAQEREAELARMLGGTDGDTARAHAAQLMQTAHVGMHGRRPKPAARSRRRPGRKTTKQPVEEPV